MQCALFAANGLILSWNDLALLSRWPEAETLSEQQLWYLLLLLLSAAALTALYLHWQRAARQPEDEELYPVLLDPAFWSTEEWQDEQEEAQPASPPVKQKPAYRRNTYRRANYAPAAPARTRRRR